MPQWVGCGAHLRELGTAVQDCGARSLFGSYIIIRLLATIIWPTHSTSLYTKGQSPALIGCLCFMANTAGLWNARSGCHMADTTRSYWLLWPTPKVALTKLFDANKGQCGYPQGELELLPLTGHPAKRD